MKTTANPYIFVVEDDIMYREIIKNELEENNCKNIEFFSLGKDCINNLHKNPDIVLLDYMLEGELNGLQVLKKIKSTNPDTEVIMMSAQEKLEVAVNSLKHGAYDYIVKNDSAMNRMSSLIGRICKLNKLIEENKQVKKIRTFILIAMGVLLTILIILNQLFPRQFS